MADRLAIAAGLIALVVRGAFPLWAAVLDPCPRRRRARGRRGRPARRTRAARRPVDRQGRDLLAHVAIPAISWGTLGLAAVAGRAPSSAGSAFAVGIIEYYVAAAAYWLDVRAVTAARVSARSGGHRSPSRRRPDLRPGRKPWSSPRTFGTRRSTSGCAPRAAGSASASPTTRRTRSATWSTSTCRRSGTSVEANQPLGEVESTKSVSDVFSPVRGTIVERNPLGRSAARARERAALRRRLAGRDRDLRTRRGRRPARRRRLPGVAVAPASSLDTGLEHRAALEVGSHPGLEGAPTCTLTLAVALAIPSSWRPGSRVCPDPRPSTRRRTREERDGVLHAAVDIPTATTRGSAPSVAHPLHEDVTALPSPGRG